MKNPVILPCFLFLAQLALFSCAEPPQGSLPDAIGIPELPPDPENGGSQQQLTWLFVPESENAIRFHTKDPAYTAGKGRTLWKITGTMLPGTELRSGVIRYSGNDRGGSGLVLQFSENDSPEFYLILTDTLGHGFAGRYRSGILTVLDPWSTRAGLNSGKGILNRISVTDRGAGAFDISFNGGEVWEIRDPLPSVLPGTGQGWCAVVTPDELFPLRPVDIRYIKEE